MAITSVIAASIRGCDRQGNSSGALKPVSAEWNKQFPVVFLDDFNAPIINISEAQLKQVAQKKICKREINKTNQAMTKFQMEPETICSAKKNIQSIIRLFDFMLFGLVLIFCITILLLSLPKLLAALLITLLLAEFVPINSGLHEKQPASKNELKIYSNNFMHSNESYKNNSETNFRAPENTFAYSNSLADNINTTKLNFKFSLFKIVTPKEEQVAVKKELLKH